MDQAIDEGTENVTADSLSHTGRTRRRIRILAALIIRETCARFGRSWGGYLWALAEPAGAILLFAIAFSYISRRPPIGTSFIFFYATGIIPFLTYNSIANAAMQAIRANRGLLTYPVITPLDTVIARALLELLTHVLIATILFYALAIWESPRLVIEPLALATALSMAAVLGLGVGTLNCVFIGFFPTWQSIWSVLNRPLFLISGVLFTFDSLPAQLRDVLWFNPVAHIVVETRFGFYGVATPGFVDPVYVFGTGMTLFVIGAFLLKRNEGFLINA